MWIEFPYIQFASEEETIGKPSVEKLGDRLGDKRKLIMELIKENNRISMPQIVQELGISSTAVKKTFNSEGKRTPEKSWFSQRRLLGSS